MTKAQAAAYLAGMIDGEGHIGVKRNRIVSVSSTDRELIEAVVECCDLLGLHQTVQNLVTKPPRKPGWQVIVTGKESLMTIRDHVPIRCHRKREALAQSIAAYKYKRRPSREWLEQKYIGEGLSLQEVAEAFGNKNSVSAHCWLKYYGIPRRTQSEAQTKYPRPQKAWLEDRVAEGLTLEEIGLHEDLPVATPLASVWHWCQHYNIERDAKARSNG